MKEKVVIGVPSGGSVHAVMVESLIALQNLEFLEPSERYELIDIIFASGLYVQENRNNLVRSARKLGADWLLQIDSDHSFKPNFLRMIMRHADMKERPIIAGLYSSIGKVEESSFVVNDCIFKIAENGQYYTVEPPSITQPFEVDATGSGLLLTHMSVFDVIEEPWFWLAMFEDKEQGVYKMMNEDISFCRMAKAHKFRIFCDPLAEANHWKNVPLLPSSMREFLEASAKAKSSFEAMTKSQ